MLNEQEAKELEALKAECLDEQGKPRTDGVDTEKLVRLAELEALADETEEEVPNLADSTVAELKVIARDMQIKGYANMNKATLIAELSKGPADDEPVKPTVPDQTEVELMESQGYKHLGKAPNGRNCYKGPDKRAYMTNAKGAVENVGLKFGEKLLKHLKG